MACHEAPRQAEPSTEPGSLTFRPSGSSAHLNHGVDQEHATDAHSDAYDDAFSYDAHSYTDHEPSYADQRVSHANEQPSDSRLSHDEKPSPYADDDPTNLNGDSMLSPTGHNDTGCPGGVLAVEQPPEVPRPPSTLDKFERDGSNDEGNTDAPFGIPMVWDQRSVQDEDMSPLGIVAHPELKILTCITCKRVIDPDGIRKHISRHLPRQVVNKVNCDGLRNRFSLIAKKDLKIPRPFILAIPTLPVYRNFPHCPKCGYAVRNDRSFYRHTSCGKIKSQLGYAQAYFPEENHGGFFAVTVSEPPTLEPGLNLMNVLKKKYPDPVAGQTPITLSQHVRDTNPFLAKSAWPQIVEGLTGEQVWNAVRKDNEGLRKSVTPSVKRYMEEVNAKLGSSGCDNEGSAIGSYHGFV